MAREARVDSAAMGEPGRSIAQDRWFTATQPLACTADGPEFSCRGLVRKDCPVTQDSENSANALCIIFGHSADRSHLSHLNECKLILNE